MVSKTSVKHLTGKMFLANSNCIMYNKHDKRVQTKLGKTYLLIFE